MTTHDLHTFYHPIATHTSRFSVYISTKPTYMWAMEHPTTFFGWKFHKTSLCIEQEQIRASYSSLCTIYFLLSGTICHIGYTRRFNWIDRNGTDQYDEKPCFDSMLYIKLKIFTHFHNIDSLNNSLQQNINDSLQHISKMFHGVMSLSYQNKDPIVDVSSS